MELPALAGDRSRAPARRGILLGALLAPLTMAALAPVAAVAQTPGSTAATSPGALTLPTRTDVPPPGRARAAREVIATAEAVPKIRDLRRANPSSYVRAYIHGDRAWQVSVFRPRRGRDEEIGQVLVDDRTGAALEAYTGFQVAWTMARGYPGAFGRKVNALYVWLPLLGLFLLPFLRPPWRLLHLDLAVLCAFSVSYALFGAARIDLSVPLVYPCLLYLLVRMLMLARARGREEAFHVKRSLPLVTSPGFLGMAVVFLLGFRLGLNVAASNVIDVGYSGVIGADLLGSGETLYGGFPPDNARGDTYGPVNYLAYVPFEQALPWRGTWDDLPAAHAAALAFDLASVGLLWLLGRQVRGPRLGLLLGYLWLAFPFTLLVSNSNANDSLVAALVLGAVLLAARPLARGTTVAAAGLTKFAPLALLPLFVTYPPGHEGRRDRAARSRPALLTGIAALVAGAALIVPAVVGEGGLATFWDRSVGFQADRESPFSFWGYHDLGWAQSAVAAGAFLLALAVAFVPRRRDVVSLAALAAAVLIAVQLAVTHWFYLYIVWFLPLVLFALLAEHDEPAAAT